MAANIPPPPPLDPAPYFVCAQCRSSVPYDDLERVSGIDICATCFYDVVEQPRKRMSKRLRHEVTETAGPIDITAKSNFPPLGYSL